MQYVEISYASEQNKYEDPILKTYFYKKDEPWKAIRGDDDVWYFNIEVKVLSCI